MIFPYDEDHGGPIRPTPEQIGRYGPKMLPVQSRPSDSNVGFYCAIVFVLVCAAIVAGFI